MRARLAVWLGVLLVMIPAGVAGEAIAGLGIPPTPTALYAPPQSPGVDAVLADPTTDGAMAGLGQIPRAKRLGTMLADPGLGVAGAARLATRVAGVEPPGTVAFSFGGREPTLYDATRALYDSLGIATSPATLGGLRMNTTAATLTVELAAREPHFAAVIYAVADAVMAIKPLVLAQASDLTYLLENEPRFVEVASRLDPPFSAYGGGTEVLPFVFLSTEEAKFFDAYRSRLASLDLSGVFSSSLRLASAVDQSLVGLQLAQGGPSLGEPIIFMDPLHLIALGGTANTSYAEHHYVVIDLGGNDVYENNAGASACHDGFFCLDLPKSGEEPRFAAVALDLSGDDSYRVNVSRLLPGSMQDVPVAACGSAPIRVVSALGSTTLGVGMLVDVQGNDSYRVVHDTLWCEAHPASTFAPDSFAMGSGFWGLGLLWDRAGNDAFVEEFGAWLEGRDAWGRHSGLGAAGLAGLGVLLDTAGDDAYGVVRGKGTRYSLSMGASLRGMGLQYDLAGADSYSADIYGAATSNSLPVPWCGGFVPAGGGSACVVGSRGFAAGLPGTCDLSGCPPVGVAGVAYDGDGFDFSQRIGKNNGYWSQTRSGLGIDVSATEMTFEEESRAIIDAITPSVVTEALSIKALTNQRLMPLAAMADSAVAGEAELLALPDSVLYDAVKDPESPLNAQPPGVLLRSALRQTVHSLIALPGVTLPTLEPPPIPKGTTPPPPSTCLPGTGCAAGSPSPSVPSVSLDSSFFSWMYDEVLYRDPFNATGLHDPSYQPAPDDRAPSKASLRVDVAGGRAGLDFGTTVWKATFNESADPTYSFANLSAFEFYYRVSCPTGPCANGTARAFVIAENETLNLTFYRDLPVNAPYYRWLTYDVEVPPWATKLTFALGLQVNAARNASLSANFDGMLAIFKPYPNLEALVDQVTPPTERDSAGYPAVAYTRGQLRVFSDASTRNWTVTTTFSRTADSRDAKDVTSVAVAVNDTGPAFRYAQRTKFLRNAVYDENQHTDPIPLGAFNPTAMTLEPPVHGQAYTYYDVFVDNTDLAKNTTRTERFRLLVRNTPDPDPLQAGTNPPAGGGYFDANNVLYKIESSEEVRVRETPTYAHDWPYIGIGQKKFEGTSQHYHLRHTFINKLPEVDDPTGGRMGKLPMWAIYARHIADKLDRSDSAKGDHSPGFLLKKVQQLAGLLAYANAIAETGSLLAHSTVEFDRTFALENRAFPLTDFLSVPHWTGFVVGGATFFSAPAGGALFAGYELGALPLPEADYYPWDHRLTSRTFGTPDVFVMLENQASGPRPITWWNPEPREGYACLWHQSPALSPFVNETVWAYGIEYSDPSTGQPTQWYNSQVDGRPSRNACELRSGAITLFEQGATNFTFHRKYSVEQASSSQVSVGKSGQGDVYDVMRLEMRSLTKGSGWELLRQWDSSRSSPATWKTERIAIDGRPGEIVEFRFVFDTMDEVSNNWFGWAFSKPELTQG